MKPIRRFIPSRPAVVHRRDPLGLPRFHTILRESFGSFLPLPRREGRRRLVKALVARSELSYRLARQRLRRLEDHGWLCYRPRRSGWDLSPQT